MVLYETFVLDLDGFVALTKLFRGKDVDDLREFDKI